MDEVLKWVLIVFLSLLVLYIAARLVSSAWFNTKYSFMRTERQRFNALIEKANKKGVK